MFQFLAQLTRDCTTLVCNRRTGHVTFYLAVPDGLTWKQVLERYLALFPDYAFCYDYDFEERVLHIYVRLTEWYAQLLLHSQHLKRKNASLFVSRINTNPYAKNTKEKR